MRLIGLMPVRNEAWVIGLSIRVVLGWVDELVVLDHASTDASPEILLDLKCEYPGRLHLLMESNPDWPEMAHRQVLLEKARELRATHIAIVDADEILTANHVDSIRAAIGNLPPGGYMCTGMPCMWRSLDAYRVDPGIWSNRHDLTLAFADSPELRWHALNGYDHHQRAPYGSRLMYRMYGKSGGVMHLQWASWRRLVAKHNRYKMMERVKYPDKRIEQIDSLYSLATNERGLQTAVVPAEWWAGYEHLRKYVDLNAEPWHEAECKRLLNLHGRDYFRGLNLSGMECLSQSL